MNTPEIRLLSLTVALAIIGCGDSSRSDAPDDRTATHPPDPAPVGNVRPPAVAGAFYDRDPRTLESNILRHLQDARKPAVTGRLTAAVVPHAGYVYSGRCAAALYTLIRKNAYSRIIILGPSHSRTFRGIAVPAADITAHRTPLGDIPIDQKVCTDLRGKAGFSSIPDVDTGEHSIEVQYPFLQETAGTFKLVPLICGMMSEKDLDNGAAVLASYLNDRTLLLASSDFTHYGRRFQYVPFTDNIKANLYAALKRSTGLIAGLNTDGFDEYLEDTQDTICGSTPIRILLRTLNAQDPPPNGVVLDCYSSGDLSGDFRDCVSYASIGFFMKAE